MRHYIGVVGSSTDGTFDPVLAKEILEQELGLRAVQYEDCALVSGLTDMGVPGIAYRVAGKLGMYLVGVACKKALEMARYPVDKEIIVGEEWGDESETFLGMIDELIQMGRSPQATREFEAFQGPKVRRDLPYIEKE